MSWWWLLFGPLLVYILVAIVQDLRGYLRTLKYKAQGFTQRYSFLAGSQTLYLPDRSVYPDIYSRYKRELAKVGTGPGLVINSSPRGKATVYLTDPSLVHEACVCRSQHPL